MNKTIKLLLFVMLLAVLVFPSGIVHAQTPQPQNGGVLFGTNFTLRNDETLNGDLVVLGGNVTIEKGSVVNGDVVVIGGTVTSDSRMNGDVVAIGGQITLNDNARVSGDVVTVGGQVNRAAGAEVQGEIVNNVPAPNVTINPPTPPNPPRVPTPFMNNPVAATMGVFFRAVVVALLAMLVMVFLQPQVGRVGQAIVSQPVAAGGFGLLTIFLAPIVLVIMVVTLILIPVAFIGVVLLMLAWLFGMIAMGYEVGDRFTRAVNQSWAPVLTAGFGTFMLMLIGGSFAFVPCVGWLAPFLIGLMGIGGVAMTWFGSRPYIARAVPAAPVPTEPPIPPPS